MPLNLLQEGQAEKLKAIAGANPFVLNGDTNTGKNRCTIGAGAYTHGKLSHQWITAEKTPLTLDTVFTSPEIATSKSFNKDILQRRAFMDRLALVAIDELHLVNEWSQFRPQYRPLHLLRPRIDLSVPFLGVSATLDFTVLQDVKEAVGFDNDISVERTSMDRPELYIEVDALKYDYA
jgi:superfamily II DNA helicase RecQ